MLKMYVYLVSLLLLPHTQVLSVKQAQGVLDVSVLIRAKQFTIDEKHQVVRGMIGCSGTFISPSVVLTAAHCFDAPTTDIWVRGTANKSYRALIVKLDPEHDLALLVVTGKHKYAQIATHARVGEQVINVGSPAAFEFLVSEGIVAALGHRTKRFKSSYIVHTAMINSGSSGGGAFNAKGELIGVNTLSFGMFGWQGISLAVDSETIRGFLK